VKGTALPKNKSYRGFLIPDQFWTRCKQLYQLCNWVKLPSAVAVVTQEKREQRFADQWQRFALLLLQVAGQGNV